MSRSDSPTKSTSPMLLCGEPERGWEHTRVSGERAPKRKAATNSDKEQKKNEG